MNLRPRALAIRPISSAAARDCHLMSANRARHGEA
jgi:hypothetical protein